MPTCRHADTNSNLSNSAAPTCPQASVSLANAIAIVPDVYCPPNEATHNFGDSRSAPVSEGMIGAKRFCP
ncbi:unnamed protein product [Protopolystoma xenopodis]|uniref:Uncharacterized protein n=1 Tax=Protopolystoma xenopodis TaxID=117903 RepID=A0A3S5B3F5_9PLAT|nr:unnamed protein product [Protopolystoma xenopodis]